MFVRLVAFIIWIGFGHLAMAQDLRWFAERGHPYTVRWADGREAGLKITHINSGPLVSTFKIVDNDCTTQRNMTCRYRFAYRLYWMTLVWTKNPDPTRVGQIVEKNSASDPSFKKLDHMIAARAGVQAREFPLLNAGLPPQQIECDDFSWLPGAQSEAPHHVHISRWEGEDNDVNPETGHTESRSLGGYFGVDLNRVSVNSLEFTAVNAAVGETSLSDLLMGIPTQSLTVNETDGGVCQIGLSSNLRGELTETSHDLHRRRPDPAQQPTFVVGSNEILTLPHVRYRLSYWVTTRTPAYR